MISLTSLTIHAALAYLHQSIRHGEFMMQGLQSYRVINTLWENKFHNCLYQAKIAPSDLQSANAEKIKRE